MANLYLLLLIFQNPLLGLKLIRLVNLAFLANCCFLQTRIKNMRGPYGYAYPPGYYDFRYEPDDNPVPSELPDFQPSIEKILTVTIRIRPDRPRVATGLQATWAMGMNGKKVIANQASDYLNKLL